MNPSINKQANKLLVFTIDPVYKLTVCPASAVGSQPRRSAPANGTASPPPSSPAGRARAVGPGQQSRS